MEEISEGGVGKTFFLLVADRSPRFLFAKF